MFDAKVIAVCFIVMLVSASLGLVSLKIQTTKVKNVITAWLIGTGLFASVYCFVAGIVLLTGWQNPLTNADPHTIATVSIKGSGRGWIVILAIAFWPYILIGLGGYFAYLYQGMLLSFIKKRGDIDSMETDTTKLVAKEQKAKETLTKLHGSIKIVSNYGAVIEETSEEKLLFIPESRLPYSREEIANAIITVELFIETALNDGILKKLLIEKHNSFFFDKAQAEYILSEKYRESLKTCFALLDMFVSNEEAEKRNEQYKTVNKAIDIIKEEEIKPTDDLNPEE